MLSANNKCVKCGGKLVEEDVFLDRIRLKRIVALFIVILPLLVIISPVFCIIRIIVLGGFETLGNKYIEIILSIIPQKLLVGVIISFILSLLLGISGKEKGIFISTIIGAIAGGFFMGASHLFPLRPEGEYRWDIVIVALSGGILMGGISIFAEFCINRIFTQFLKPTIYEEKEIL